MEGRQERVEPLDRAYDLSSLAAKWRQSHGVIAQCNSAAASISPKSTTHLENRSDCSTVVTPIAGRT
jgi:hypothetical protein